MKSLIIYTKNKIHVKLIPENNDENIALHCIEEREKELLETIKSLKKREVNKVINRVGKNAK